MRWGETEKDWNQFTEVTQPASGPTLVRQRSKGGKREVWKRSGTNVCARNKADLRQMYIAYPLKCVGLTTCDAAPIWACKKINGAAAHQHIVWNRLTHCHYFSFLFRHSRKLSRKLSANFHTMSMSWISSFDQYLIRRYSTPYISNNATTSFLYCGFGIGKTSMDGKITWNECK